MTALNTLTTLTRVKSWVGISSSNEDSTLTSIIAEVSRFIHSYLGRATLLNSSYTEILDGAGTTSILLRQWPVSSIISLVIDTDTVSQASGTMDSGYVLDSWDGISSGMQQRLSVRGYSFRRGIGNINVTYNAGYIVKNEAQVVPVSSPYTVNVNAPYGNFAANVSVVYANGNTLTAVTSNPLTGQYTVSGGVYSFSSGDAGGNVLITYSYVPADIEHACVALVAERYRSRSRIGEISKSLGGQESVSFSQKDMPEFVRTLLQPYKRVVD